ncbi:MAG: 50S ribosomal protein L13 [Patescibacteria group bacterium]
MKTQQSFMQRKEDVKRDWHLVDVSGKILGKVATEIATLLIGKNKPTYTPHTEAGDYVVVVNAAKVQVTGNKVTDKIYFHHTGFPGGIKQRSFGEMIDRNPEEVIRLAVVNMLPKNRLRDVRMARLKIYAGEEHNHASQLSKK